MGRVSLYRTQQDEVNSSSFMTKEATLSGSKELEVAVKIVEKKDVLERGTIKRVMAERDILTFLTSSSSPSSPSPHSTSFSASTSSPSELATLANSEHGNFFPILLASLQDDSNLYLIMEAILGGALCTHLAHSSQLFPWNEKRARFFAAEVLSALTYLHSHGILHRDIKASNVLLRENGHVCIVDFDTATRLNGEDKRAYSFVGTAHCMAPEVARRRGRQSPVVSMASDKNNHGSITKGIAAGSSGSSTRSGTAAGDSFDDAHEDHMGGDEGTKCSCQRHRVPPQRCEKGYDWSVDWWSFGVLLCELLSRGKSPLPWELDRTNKDAVVRYLQALVPKVAIAKVGPAKRNGGENENENEEEKEGEDMKKRKEKEGGVRGDTPSPLPSECATALLRETSCSEDAVQVVCSLLSLDPSERLDGVKLKADPWFHGVDWDDVASGRETSCSEDAVQVVCSLLSLDPSERLDGVKLKADPWFHGVDWDDVASGRLHPIPPFNPSLGCEFSLAAEAREPELSAEEAALFDAF